MSSVRSSPSASDMDVLVVGEVYSYVQLWSEAIRRAVRLKLIGAPLGVPPDKVTLSKPDQKLPTWLEINSTYCWYQMTNADARRLFQTNNEFGVVCP